MDKSSPEKPAAKKSGSFSPAPYMVAGYATIFMAFGVFGTWAATAPLESAVVSSGTVSVESSRKVIQHLEGGIISEIVAREGDIVEVGAVLIRLDPTQALGNYLVLDARHTVLKATEARLLAESTGADEIAFPAELLAAENLTVREAMALEETLFRDRKRTHDGQIAILGARIHQIEEGVVGLTQQLEAVSEQIVSLDSELERLTRGQETGVVATNQLAQTTRAALELKGQRGQITAEIAKMRQTVAETELQIMQLSQEFIERAGAELRDIRDQLNEVQERLTVAQNIFERTVITAPVRGMVQNIRAHTTGGVIRPADPVMDIVPLDDDLVVNARIRPVDIDLVEVGMSAEVRFHAFSSRTTPVIFGTVTILSQDVIEPQRQGEEPYYLARVEVEDANVPMEIRGRLMPGMPSDVIIATGDRTMVQYLLKPIEDSFQRGMREQ